MFTLEKEFTFEAAHRLPNHDGKCARLHGHSWRGRIVVEGKHLVSAGAKRGMLVDYVDLKSVIQPLLDDVLDHHYLNETMLLADPTSEEIARFIWNAIEIPVSCFGVRLAAVVIEETCTSRCSYTGEEPEQLNFNSITCED